MKIKREGVEQLNNLLNKSINSKNTPVKGTVSEDGVKLMNRYINLDMDRCEYIVPTEYLEYASELSKAFPDYVIDRSITEKEDIESIVNLYINSSDSILKIDYALTHNSNDKPMYAIFRRRSEYSIGRQDICLVDKRSNAPISAFLITNNQFYKYINSFLLDNIC